MALILANDTIEVFTRVTQFDFSGYMRDFVNFLDYHYQDMVSYYKGQKNTLPQQATDSFDSLLKKRDILDGILVNNMESFGRGDYWNLLEYIDEVSAKLMYIEKLGKFLRSVKYKGFNEDSLNIDYTMTNYDTVESVVSDREVPQDDWVDVFVQNQVYETDYRAEEGGLNLIVGKRGVNVDFLETVVDRLVGENFLGKDLDKVFVFEDNDLKVLSPRDTFKQAVLMLAGFSKGDVPEFPNLGISKDVVVGGNIGVLNVVFVSRELRETFATDDTMINFSVNDVVSKDGTIFIDYEVESYRNFVYKNMLEI